MAYLELEHLNYDKVHMKPYPKIHTIWKRDTKGRLIYGEYSTEEIEYLANSEWEWTEKVDGMNIRIHWDGSTVYFAGRTDNAHLPHLLLEYLKATFTPSKLKYVSHHPFTLYGEGFGAGINKVGSKYSVSQQFILFDALFGTWWLKRSSLEDIAKTLNIRVVPVVGSGNLDDMIYEASNVLCRWAEEYPLHAEGIVARPKVRLLDRNGSPVMTKIKRRDLLKSEVEYE